MHFIVARQDDTIENKRIKTYKLTKVSSIFNEESVRWNLNK